MYKSKSRWLRLLNWPFPSKNLKSVIPIEPTPDHSLFKKKKRKPKHENNNRVIKRLQFIGSNCGADQKACQSVIFVGNQDSAWFGYHRVSQNITGNATFYPLMKKTRLEIIWKRVSMIRHYGVMWAWWILFDLSFCIYFGYKVIEL